MCGARTNARDSGNGKQFKPIILQVDQIDQELSLIRLDHQSTIDVAATFRTTLFPLKAQGAITQKDLLPCTHAHGLLQGHSVQY